MKRRPGWFRTFGAAPPGLLLVLALLMMAGCRDAVHTKASEQSANEVLLALLEAGVDAEKVAADEKTFDVEVARSDMARALAVLHVQGLPRSRTDSLGDLFKKDGLVSTPAEERVRYLYGVSQELEKTLLKIDGVVHGRIHIVIPANDPLAEAKKASSASVFVKYRPPADPSTLGPLVRSLVMRAVEGLDAEHVSVAFVAGTPSDARPIKMAHWLGLKVSADALPWLWTLLGILLTAVVACLAFVRRLGWDALRGGRASGQLGSSAPTERAARREERERRPAGDRGASQVRQHE